MLPEIAQTSQIQPIFVLGTTPYAGVLIDMFECLDNIRFTGCIENRERDRCGQTLAGLPILWYQDITEHRQTHQLICALATTHRVGWIENMLSFGFKFATLVHPSSVVSKRTNLGAGVLVDAGCVIAGYSSLAPHTRIGRRVSLGHHTTIGMYSTIHPGAIISGNCTIGEKVIIGTGAVIIDGITIGAGAVIAAGSVVTKNVSANAMVAGNPALLKRENYGPK